MTKFGRALSGVVSSALPGVGRRRRPPVAPEPPPSGWAVDPSGRHEHRFWDGQRWSQLVADPGWSGNDPMVPDAPPIRTAISPDDLVQPPLDLDSFFADQRRTNSHDSVLGDRWHSKDEGGVDYQLYWLDSTGECYLLRTPPDRAPTESRLAGSVAIASVFLDWAGGKFPPRYPVEVLTTGMAFAEVERRLEGWRSAMATPDGVAWLRIRLRDPGWYPDRAEHYRWRYWDGAAWTRYVSSTGSPSIDPLWDRAR